MRLFNVTDVVPLVREIAWLCIGSLYERLRGPIAPAPVYTFDGLPEFEFCERGEEMADAWRRVTVSRVA